MEKGRIIRDLVSTVYFDINQVQRFIRSDIKWKIEDYLVTIQYLQEEIKDGGSIMEEMILGYLLSDFRRLSESDIKLIDLFYQSINNNQAQKDRASYNKIGNLKTRKEILENLKFNRGYDIDLEDETLKRGALFVKDSDLGNICFKVFQGEFELGRLRKVLPETNSYYVLETDLSMDLVYNLFYNNPNRYLFLYPRIGLLGYKDLKFREEKLWRKVL